MDQNKDIDFSKPVDINAAQRAEMARKIDEYNMKFHPDKQPSEVPDGIQTYEISDKDKNEADIAKICELIEKKSLEAHSSKKKSIKLNANKIAGAIVLSTITISSLAAFFIAFEKRITKELKVAELNAAVEYMDETVMSEVLFNSGFEILGKDSKGNYIYNFNRLNGIKAVEKLVDKGLTKESAELLIDLKFNFDQRLFPEGMTADMYYIKQGYKIGENENEALLVMDGGIRPYIEANQDKLIEEVNRIKEEGKTNNARG